MPLLQQYSLDCKAQGCSCSLPEALTLVLQHTAYRQHELSPLCSAAGTLLLVSANYFGYCR